MEAVWKIKCQGYTGVIKTCSMRCPVGIITHGFMANKNTPTILLCGKFGLRWACVFFFFLLFSLLSLRKAPRTISSRGQSLQIFPCMVTCLTHFTIFRLLVSSFLCWSWEFLLGFVLFFFNGTHHRYIWWLINLETGSFAYPIPGCGEAATSLSCHGAWGGMHRSPELVQRGWQPFTLKVTPLANLDSPIKLTCLFLDCARKLDYPEREPPETQRWEVT